jgi:hypothetical protein
MRVKVQNGTVRHSDASLCNSCRFSTIIRGQAADEEIVQCQATAMRPTAIRFKVTFCSSYFDARLPTYMQMLEEAWILQPGSKKRRAGFVRGADLPPEELSTLAIDMDTGGGD